MTKQHCQVAAFLVLVALPITAGQQGTSDARSERGRQFLGLGPAADPVAAERGRQLFTENCAFCHGANATGAEGPDLVRSTIVLHDEKGETIAPVVLKGRPDKGMPSFASLTSAQVYDLAEFLHQRVEQAANRFGYQMQNVITGNPKAGQAFFNGAGHCTGCHSPAGDLAHVASKFEPPDLQAQFLYPSERAPEARKKNSLTPRVIIQLPSGETASGALKRIDDFEVSIWDALGSYRSWPRDEVKVQIEDPLAAHRELLSKYTDADMHNILAYLETLK
ncbi:MAG: c-type cytochrome [Acidobacteriaceae bacterium]|nr:c-type cytochrome [Acidobacteriaceae bacterium]